MPAPFGPGEILHEAGTFNDFMPPGEAMMEPWDMNFADHIMMDGFDAKQV